MTVLPTANTRKPFWKTMQKGFPNLVSLTILSKASGERGRYALRRLEILDIEDWEGFQLVCPSLKHLAIGHSNSYEVYEFVIEHSYQLESFIVPTWPPRFSAAPNDFWSTICPNIVTFGKLITARPLNCPSDHPLRHLLLTSAHKGIRFETMLSEIDSFPQIRSVHIRAKDLRVDVANEFRRRWQEKGIRVMEIVDGETEHIPPPRSLGMVLKAKLVL